MWRLVLAFIAALGLSACEPKPPKPKIDPPYERSVH